jgi:hypothetical protein
VYRAGLRADRSRWLPYLTSFTPALSAFLPHLDRLCFTYWLEPACNTSSVLLSPLQVLKARARLRPLTRAGLAGPEGLYDDDATVTTLRAFEQELRTAFRLAWEVSEPLDGNGSSYPCARLARVGPAPRGEAYERKTTKYKTIIKPKTRLFVPRRS